ncbi:MAG: DegT/DnrJ/EryC1/StrS family aminotransferase [Armatimonadetes bacterium]|nr:DegT/DnrJ/EryC1/StrS family aminotransferase [Armatimonadota bacterium]
MSKLALLGGTPVRTRPWPHWPDVREEDVEAVAHAIRSGKWWQHEGERVTAFEQQFASYQDAAYGVAVNSGTTALQVALEALGVGPGAEVIVPAYTFQATAGSVLLAGAVPVFADVDPDTMNIAPGSVEELLTDRTRAIMPVHIAGLLADMDRIMTIAKARGLLVIEDAAQAHGAIWRDRKVGAIGEAGCFSFQASKNLPAGEGGLITTDDGGVYARAASLRDVGRVKGRPFYEHHTLGYNYRMTEMQGALLLSRLRHLEGETEIRYRNGRLLTEVISQLPGVTPLDPEPAPGDRRAYHLYPIRLEQELVDVVPRERFLEALRAEGIPCMEGYGRPLYHNPVFQKKDAGAWRETRAHGTDVHVPDYSEVCCPVAEDLCERVVWLPQQLLLGTDADIADIAAAVQKVVMECSVLAR